MAFSKKKNDSGAVYFITSNILRTSNWEHPCDTLFINMVKKDSLITTIKIRTNVLMEGVFMSDITTRERSGIKVNRS